MKYLIFLGNSGGAPGTELIGTSRGLIMKRFDKDFLMKDLLSMKIFALKGERWEAIFISLAVEK